MAVQAPDPRDFKTWEDAFQYPVPVVRRLEQQLRGNINENRSKLRSLVGTSYRDLLGTADRIIHMDDAMQHTETHLSDMGKKCNARAVERISLGHARMARLQREQKAKVRGLASTLALLQNCMDAAARFTKRHESALLAAKLLVLARLLHKSASESPDAPPLLNSLRTKLASLRKKLLNHVDRHLASTTSNSGLAETLVAYSLATSSTPTDVLRHFLRVRLQAIHSLAENMTSDDIHTALDLLVVTLKDAQTAFPKQLSNLLAHLKEFPLLRDAQIRGIPELDLDLHGRWISESVRNYTPWPRHDQLQTDQALDVLRPWGKEATRTLIGGIERLLSTISSPVVLVELRTRTLRQALAVDCKTAGLDHSALVQELRTCFMSSLSGLAASRADTLNAIIDSILNTTRRTPGNSHPTDLWNPDIGEMDLQRGAVAFRQRVASGALGKDDRLRAASDALDGWFTGIAELGSLVKSLRDERWDDDFDVDEDDLDLDAPQEMLSREDPDSLEETLRSSSEAAREKFLERMNEEIDKLEEGDVDTDTGHRAIFLLRLLREVTQRYRAMPRTSSSSSSSTSSHGSQPHTPSNLLSSLHDVLALHIMRQSSLYRQPERPAVALWEGTPPLPVQPSPSCFRYVRDISRRMESAGGDLWTRSALDNLKGKLIDKISQPLNEVVTAKGGSATIATSGSEINGVGGDDSDTIGAAEDQAETAGDAGDTNGAEEQRAVWVQMLFDICYLSNILRKSEEGGQAGLEKATEDLKKRAEMEDAALERVRKSALEYYKRTYLFFGVLANH